MAGPISEPENLFLSPATGNWAFHLAKIQSDGGYSWSPVIFNSTGAVDSKSIPALNGTHMSLQHDPIQHWMGFLNWIFVSQYWLTLYDVGQIAPLSYNTTVNGQPNFSEPIIGSSEYNIFVKYQTYSSYLSSSILFRLRFVLPPANWSYEFLPLNDTHRLQLASTSIYQSYSCEERRAKGWFSILISVFAADYHYGYLSSVRAYRRVLSEA